MKSSLFDYHLPGHLIAQVPAERRTGSRLFVYNRQSGEKFHRSFADIVDFISPGDLIVVNSSKVLPARIYIESSSTLNKPEVLFLRILPGGYFEGLVKPGRKFKPGTEHSLPGGYTLEVCEITAEGNRIMRIHSKNESGESTIVQPMNAFRRFGEMPLPPYITSRESDPQRYQTVFACEEGSIAAPTAGLHFDEELLSSLRRHGVSTAELTLHVGIGTFKPIGSENIDDHKMHSEEFYINERLAALYSETRKRGGSVWACGTTCVRALESAAYDSSTLRTGFQTADCFIKPGYQFKAADHLITNFHLPRSTLIVLVSAFCGRDTILKLYQEAIDMQYRFYSFGDAMLMI